MGAGTLEDIFMETEPCERLSDAKLLDALKALVAGERQGLVAILRHLAEVDRRDLPQKTGYSSLFMFCLGELGYSEGAAYRRIHAARAARRWPIIYAMLGSGRITLSVVSLLAPCLDQDNHRRLLEQASGKNKREVEALLAELRPTPPAADSIRRMGPAPVPPRPDPGADKTGADLFTGIPDRSRCEGAGGGTAGEDDSPRDAPTSPAEHPTRVHFSFTGDESLLARLKRARELLRHRNPDGGAAAIFSLAIDALLERIDPERAILRKARRGGRARPAPAPRPDSITAGAESESGTPARTRHIPAWARREVWKRDGGRCTFAAPSGKRCEERGFLELDHIQPFALGGRSDPGNLRLRCRAHNLLTAREFFGQDAVPRRADSY